MAEVHKNVVDRQVHPVLVDEVEDRDIGHRHAGSHDKRTSSVSDMFLPESEVLRQDYLGES